MKRILIIALLFVSALAHGLEEKHVAVFQLVHLEQVN